jgi:outer membrane cobalamin receptor
VHSHRHRILARHADSTQQQPPRLLVALLGCGAVAACPRPILAQTTGAPVYESVVVGEPISSEMAREDRAASASVITQERTPRAAESAPQLLSEQAGVAVTRLGGMGSTATLSLRGSTSNQVLVYVDGVPFNTATGGGVDLGAIPLGDVSRIEIYRGTSPIAFAASAIGGVVSITTEIPRDCRVDLDAGGGSFGTYYGGAKAAYNRARFHGYVGLHVLTGKGDFEYLDNNATNLDPTDDRIVNRRNNDLQQVDGTLQTVVDLSAQRHLGASFVFFNRDQGLPGPGTLADPKARLGTQRSTGILNYRSGQDLGSGGDVRATAYASYVRSRFLDPAGQINAIPTDADDRTLTVGATLDWRKVTRPWLILSGVLDGRFDRFRPSDSTVTGAPATRYFGATGLETDLWSEAWRLDAIASLRVEAARDETSGRDNFYNPLPTAPAVSHVLPIVRLALAKELGRSASLRANGGRYARFPSTIELYGNTGYLLGNPELVPESGFNLDIGPHIDWLSGGYRLVWSAMGFASFVDELIQYQFLGRHAQAANLGKARILGAESDVTLELGQHVRVTCSATFTDARDTSANESHNGQPLPLRPRYRLYARPELRRIPLGSRVALGIYAEVDATAGNYEDLSGIVRVPARLLLGAGLYADLPAHFSLRASGQNLGNARINDLANYPLPGREFYLTLLWSSQNHQTKDLLP